MAVIRNGLGPSSIRLCVWAGIVLLAAGLLAGSLAFGQGKSGPQKVFTTPAEAAKALGAAYRKGDRKAVAEILGDRGWRLIFSGDPVIDRHERAWFLSLYGEGHKVVVESDDGAVLSLGKDEQPYPIPLIKKGTRWRFDPSEGHEDLLSRRMSKNELSAINAVLAYTEAQREYHTQDRNSDGIAEYAQKLRSTPGQRDGLVWAGESGTAAGPLAGLAAVAVKEGYQGVRVGDLPIYRGYAYKLLFAQGPQAPGGARDYVRNGRMTEGFALVAFPLRYGISGVMTFLINQDGVVYQNDLGTKTVDLCKHMTQFNPDRSWTKGQGN